MTSRATCSLEELPLHLVADILSRLNTIEVLKSAVLSHRIFRDAFRESTHVIAQSIILNRIPEDVLPFSLALLASTRATADDLDAVPRLMTDLDHHIQDRTLALKTLSHLTLPDFDFLSRTQGTIQSLSDMFCAETLPLFSQWFHPESGHLQEATTGDHFRIHRALYRYQILCNLFCNPTDPRSSDEEVIRKEGELVMLSFAPWINEQLLCVYYFIQRAVTKAYDELAAHDIFWGSLPVSWSNEVWWSDAEEAPRLQGYLRHGLDFLDAVLRAETYDEKARLLKESKSKIISYEYEPHMQIAMTSCDPEWLEAIGVPVDMKISQLHQEGLSKRLTGPLSGTDGSTTSGPFRTWLTTHADTDLSLSVLDFEKDGNLWMCGYVIWDAMDRIQEEALRDRLVAVQQAKPLFQRYRDRWSDEQVRQSEGMRVDLNFAGAHGYWPMDRIDFSHVRDLDEGRKQRILKRWQDGAVGHPIVALSEQTLQALRSMDLG